MQQSYISDDQPSLLLAIDNASPVLVRDFARVLTAMAADYRQMNRRELVVVRVEEGSILTFLTEADAANHLIEFGKNIASDIRSSSGGRVCRKPCWRREKGRLTNGEPH